MSKEKIHRKRRSIEDLYPGLAKPPPLPARWACLPFNRPALVGTAIPYGTLQRAVRLWLNDVLSQPPSG